jgi:ATP-dependent helicase/DNAse subunit B
MRLVTGPPGSGKTDLVLEGLRAALRANDGSVRLLVPTATLAQHLAHRLAREGFVFRRRIVQTLSGFVKPWVEDTPEISEAALYLIVEEAARRLGRVEFARVVEAPGFSASMARMVAEFSSAGCDSARLAAHLPDAPLAPAFLAVYREVDKELERRGKALRARRLELAAVRISAGGLDVRTIWLDGFHALPDPELGVIAALARHADLTVTLGAGEATEPARARLLAMGFQEERAAGARPTPAIALVRAASIEREAEEIARRILEQAAAGRPFREMGIVVRAAGNYAPILGSTLERFGIPARFYFDSKLDRHAVTRFLVGAVDAMLGGWDHARTLAVLRLAPRFADSSVMDRFDFAVRSQLPNAGLGALKAAAAEGKLVRLLDALAGIEEWRSFSLAPRDWAARLGTLRDLFRPWVGEIAAPFDEIWRGQAAVLTQFETALDEAAGALEPGRAVGLEEFWRAVKSVLRLMPLRLPDGRRNVVHVLGAHEARQWVLPVVFVCGMVEKQFPQVHPLNPFFPDAARQALNSHGIRLRTAEEFEREERALFDSAVSRASLSVTLSYPEFDARGERNLPSFYLEGLGLAPVPAQPAPPPRIRPAPLAPPRGIRAPDLLNLLRARTARLSATALEIYLECPFQFFAGRTLRLEPPPRRPAERFDFLMQGNIVHAVLAEWWERPQDIEALFESFFEREIEDKRIPGGYHTERLRNIMLDDLRAFAAGDPWPRGDFSSQTERPFVLPLEGVLEISGQIDRLDKGADGRAYVIDYKYSAAQRTRARLDSETLLQAPLYLLAAERVFGATPAGMFYVGLKGGIAYAGWSDSGLMDGRSIPEGWFEGALARTRRAVEEIRAGRVEPAPAEADHCRYCDYRDACRRTARRGREMAEGA